MRVHSFLPMLPPLSGAAFLLALASCSGEGVIVPGDGTIARLEAVAGNGQRAPVGEPVPEPLVVRAEDRAGRPVTGVDIAFRFINTNGRVAPGTTTTGADGQATAEVTLGGSVGDQVVEARLVDQSGVAVEFKLTALQQESPEEGGGGGGGGGGGNGGNDGNGGNGGHGGGGGDSAGGDDGGGSRSGGGDEDGGSGGSGGSDDGGNGGHGEKDKGHDKGSHHGND
jgi:hypothetical protein